MTREQAKDFLNLHTDGKGMKATVEYKHIAHLLTKIFDEQDKLELAVANDDGVWMYKGKLFNRIKG